MRLLLLVPTRGYRAGAFLDAALRLQVDLTVASEEPSTMEGFSRGSLLTLGFGNLPRAVDQAREFAQRFPIHGVVGVDDSSIELQGAIGEALGVPTSQFSAIATARNKYRMRQALAAAGLPGPRFWLFDREQDPAEGRRLVEYPCVLKPLHLSGSRGVIRADGPPGFGAAFDRIRRILQRPDAEPNAPESRQILVESFIPGREIALEGLLIDGELHVLALFEKPDPLVGPYFLETVYLTPARLADRARRAVVEQVIRATKAVGLSEGPIHAELRLTGDSGEHRDSRFEVQPGTGSAPVVRRAGLGDTLKGTRDPETVTDGDRSSQRAKNPRSDGPGGPVVLELNPRSIGGRCSRVLTFAAGVTLEEIILRRALRLPLPSLDRDTRPAGVLMLPVEEHGVIRSIDGIEATAALPGIEEVAMTAHVGQKVAPLPEESIYLGFVFARSDSVKQVEAALDHARETLRITIESTAGGE